MSNHDPIFQDAIRRLDHAVQFAETRQIDMRTAAYAVGHSRIGEAIASPGTARFFAGE